MSEPVSTRHIRVLQFTYSDVAKLGNVEEEVNKEVDELAKKGKRVVAITTETIGFSPQYLLYTIIYEG